MMRTWGFTYEHKNFYRIYYFGVKSKAQCVCYHFAGGGEGGEKEAQNILISMYLPVCEKTFLEEYKKSGEGTGVAR